MESLNNTVMLSPNIYYGALFKKLGVWVFFFFCKFLAHIKSSIVNPAKLLLGKELEKVEVQL